MNPSSQRSLLLAIKFEKAPLLKKLPYGMLSGIEKLQIKQENIEKLGHNDIED